MKRRKSREVLIGNVGIGGDNPIRIQSMTTTNTRNAKETADQIMRLADKGCEIARVTVQGKAEALACEEIKNLLICHSYTIPLVADVHFYPPAALIASDFVDKVRINPGNYGDKRAIFKKITYTEASYQAELDKIEEKFAPLVLKCKSRGVAMRIGTNHGSLSDRIMNKFGDTPFGMVESAFEFARIARKYDFHNFVFSMKASNTKVMMQAYRLLVLEMEKLGWDYPLHLGVTEAGQDEDGRVKSAVGTGSLLLDGIGDTIRVSLTEDPENEIKPCQQLIETAKGYENGIDSIPHFTRARIAGEVLIAITATTEEFLSESFMKDIGCKKEFNRYLKSRETVDLVIVDELLPSMHPRKDELAKIGISVIEKENPRSGITLLELSGLKIDKARTFFKEREVSSERIILLFSYEGSLDEIAIQAASEIGLLLTDGLGDGVALDMNASIVDRKNLTFNILQAARLKFSKTEFIACPGCGRTLFDIQKVTKRIRERTGHLPDVKIAIMGCIVNGPGEMADADFGFVGGAPGKIDLYLGKTCVQRGIDSSLAEEKLIDLIKEQGKWIEVSTPL